MSGLDRARELAKTAATRYAANRASAEAAVVRLWWTHPGTRKVYWEHSSVKGKVSPPATVQPAMPATRTPRPAHATAASRKR